MKKEIKDKLIANHIHVEEYKRRKKENLSLFYTSEYQCSAENLTFLYCETFYT